VFNFNKIFESGLLADSKHLFRTAFLLSLVYSICCVIIICSVDYPDKNAFLVKYLFVHAPIFAWTLVFIIENKNKKFFTFNNCLICVASGIFLNLSTFVFAFYWTWFVCIFQKI